MSWDVQHPPLTDKLWHGAVVSTFLQVLREFQGYQQVHFRMLWALNPFHWIKRSYVLFATHMKQLGELASIYPNAKVCFFSVDVSDNKLQFEVCCETSNVRFGQRVTKCGG